MKVYKYIYKICKSPLGTEVFYKNSLNSTKIERTQMMVYKTMHNKQKARTL